jgi:predicted O-methyltransferase YrrM
MSAQHLQLDDLLVGYVRAVSPPEPEFLRRLREETERDPAAIMQITPEQGIFMGMLVRLIGARRCIEVGVFTGYSSISIALALPAGGRLLACDVSETWTAVARRYWREAGVEEKIELRLAPAQQTLDALISSGESGSYDFAFIDADKVNYAAYYERLLRLIRPGGLIAVDNVLWHGKVIDRSKHDPDTLAIREFNVKLQADDRIHMCLLPIGDGLTLALKK